MNRNNDDFGYMPLNSKKESNPCFECGVSTKGKHHVVPVSRGGTKVIPLCQECHNLVHGGIINSELIKEGLRKASAKGIKLGPPFKLTAEKLSALKDMKSKGMTYKQMSMESGLSVGSVHKALN